jgi:hypothetical protein
VVLQDLHPGEKLVQVDGDDFLKCDEARHASGYGAGAGTVDGNQARELVRHLDTCEQFLVADRVAHHHGQVQRKPRDVGEGVGRIHRQGREDGKYLFGEDHAELLLRRVIQFVPVHEVDVLVGQGRADLFGINLGMPLLEPVGFLADPLKHLHGAQARGRGNGQSGGDAPLEARHPDHEELVQVGGEDREEADALQQVERGVLGQFQDAGVEAEPAQLTVQEAVRADVALGLQVGRELGDVNTVLGGA